MCRSGRDEHPPALLVLDLRLRDHRGTKIRAVLKIRQRGLLAIRVTTKPVRVRR